MNDDSRTNIELANVVKGVHSKLRREYHNSGDFDKLWEDHIKNGELLGQYADAMHQLAVEHWVKNPETRIDWCRNVCKEYFYLGGLQKLLDKDERRRNFGENRIEECAEPFVPYSKNQDFGGGCSNASICTQGTSLNQLQFPLSQSTQHSECDSDVIPSLELYDQDTDTMQAVLIDQASTIVPAANYEESAKNTRGEETTNDGITDSVSHTHTVAIPGLRCLATGHAGSIGSDAAFKSGSVPAGRPCYLSTSPQRDGMAGSYADRLSPLSTTEPDMSSGEFNSKLMQYSTNKYNTIDQPFQGKLRLLDVGSCYNPFVEFEEFQAIGIDISPAVESVYHCDFLHVQTTEPLQLASDSINTYIHHLKSPVERLPKDLFHVVVFSLLLEYFPSPYQRWLCCEKAHQLLMNNGLLLIITPDSHHQNKNAPMMKSWKKAIESLGFKRWRYIKQEHLHCIAFRKVYKDHSSNLVTDLHITPDMLYIPQDKNDFQDCEDSLLEPRSFEDNQFLRSQFDELPAGPMEDDEDMD